MDVLLFSSQQWQQKWENGCIIVLWLCLLEIDSAAKQTYDYVVL